MGDTFAYSCIAQRKQYYTVYNLAIHYGYIKIIVIFIHLYIEDCKHFFNKCGSIDNSLKLYIIAS